MRKLATLLRALLWMLILSWLMAAASASAGWSMLGMLDGRTYSMDVNNISSTRQGNRLFWALIDYNHETSHGARSVAMQFEIDCRNDKIRRVQAVAYRGDLQQGGVVWVNRQTSAWTNVSRDSLNQSAQLRACSKAIKGFKIYTDQFQL